MSQPCGCDSPHMCDRHRIDLLEHVNEAQVKMLDNYRFYIDQLKKGQTRPHSILETIANLTVGYSVAWISNIILLPMMGFKITSLEASWLGVWFTLISVVRSYTMRRIFNGIHVRR